MLMPFIKEMRRGQIKGKIKNFVLIMFLKSLMDVQMQVRSWSSEKRRNRLFNYQHVLAGHRSHEMRSYIECICITRT